MIFAEGVQPERPFPEKRGGALTRGLRVEAVEVRLGALNDGSLVLRIAGNSERPG